MDLWAVQLDELARELPRPDRPEVATDDLDPVEVREEHPGVGRVEMDLQEVRRRSARGRQSGDAVSAGGAVSAGVPTRTTPSPGTHDGAPATTPAQVLLGLTGAVVADP